MEKTYQKLTAGQIEQLKNNGCTATDWNLIEVTPRFLPDYVRNVEFYGKVRMGCFETVTDQLGGMKMHTGIYNARLNNVEIGDNCLIDRIHNYVSNYKIGDNVIIENTNLIVTDGSSTFGNGVRVPVMNEGGGRELAIYDNLSSHLAYILTLYRHDTELIRNIEKMIDDYAESRRSTVGTIESNVRIFNCGTIKNTYIGEGTSLGGVSKLSNGSINSNAAAPVHLGSGVKCNDFIISSGSEITDSTLISRCFIGQGCVMGKHYSALDSVFFANCQGFHGEATAIFAGPYTVSHHKSSLLIAGMFSFLNAGSASNQSNHMYKLGPIHQGVVERGSKTTSNSYLLWPAHVGTFTLVMGRHTKHSDTSDLPFSYLIENATESYLIPAVNLRSVGTVRDAQKWPKRDNRKDPKKLDSINFNLLSPYTVQKMYDGIKVLKELTRLAGENNEIYTYQNCKIRNSSLKKGIYLYNIAITKFLGNSLISRISKSDDYKTPLRLETNEELRKRLKPSTEIGLGQWIDVGGMICPKEALNSVLTDIRNGKLTIAQAEERIADIHSHYYEYEWTWAYDKICQFTGKNADTLTIQDLIDIIKKWKNAVVTLDNMLYEDAKKEFDLNSKIGFGVDGSETDRMDDFTAVRGEFEQNSFVKNCKEHTVNKEALGDRTIEMLGRLA